MEIAKVNLIYAGAGAAAAAGLFLGAAMKPDLGMDDRPAGPQIVAADAGRSSGPFDVGGVSLAAYGGKLPDYILGTDSTVQPLAPMAASAPEAGIATPAIAAPAVADDDGVETVTLTRADYGVAPPAVSYPSIDGGTAADLAALPPPSEPDADDGQG